MDPALRQLLAEGGADSELEVILKLRTPAAIPPAVSVVARFGDVVTARIGRRDVAAVWQHPDILSVKAPRLLTPGDIVESPRLPRDDPDQSGTRTYTGRGSVVAVLDWGCDVTHPNFRLADGSTRLLALWHQGLRAQGSSPQPYGYGRSFDRAAIDAALKSANPFEQLGFHPARADPTNEGTHGTHVLDIAAGNGSAANSPVGAAPQADLIFVHLATEGLEPLATLGDTVRILEGLDFVRQCSGERPWVANLSLGRHGGPHDGRTLVEQGIDNLLIEAPGRAVVQSCGNYYEASAHATGRLRPGRSRILKWRIDPADRTPNEIEVWYSGRDILHLRLDAPEGAGTWEAALGTDTPVAIAGRVVGHAYHRAFDPACADHHIDVFLYREAPSGVWLITLTGVDVVDGRYHAWVERDAACLSCQSVIESDDVVRTSTTGTICNSLRGIAVGAYDANSPTRDLGRFSSSGPTRDGRVKPDLVAPGVAITAARSASATGDAPLTTIKSGTSMAAPRVAGTIACMFEAAAQPLSIQTTRDLLLGTTDVSDAADRHRVGSGYLNAERAIAAAAASRPTLTESVMNTEQRFGMAEEPQNSGSADQQETDDQDLDPVGSDVAAMDDALEALEAAESPEGAASETALEDEAPVKIALDARFARQSFANPAQFDLTVFGAPGEPLQGALRTGDILLRAAPGEPEFAHAALIADPALLDPSSAWRHGWRLERSGPGRYATVIELGARPHCRHDRFARRIVDRFGRLPLGQMVLRSAHSFDEEAWVEQSPIPKATPTQQRLITRRIPLEFFRRKFDEFVNQRREPLLKLRIHDNKLKVTFAKDLLTVHRSLEKHQKERSLGHLELPQWWLLKPNYTIKDLNSSRLTVNANIVKSTAATKGETFEIALDLEFETQGTEIEVNNFGNIDLQRLNIHVAFALIREVVASRGVVGFVPTVKVDVQASLNNGPDGMARRGVRDRLLEKINAALREPELHKDISRALTRWLVGGEWDVRSLGVDAAHLAIVYQEPPISEVVQPFPERPQKPLDPGKLSKIDHIVVLMMENRSFDHMLGYLKLTGVRPDIDGLTGKETNVYKSRSFPVFHLKNTVFEVDPCHGQECVIAQVSNDKMSGFAADFAAHIPVDKASKVSPGDIMGYYDAGDLPVYDALAREFLVCDKWFCSHPGGTFSNRFYAVSGRLEVDQFGRNTVRNPDMVTFAPTQMKTIFHHLDERQITWRYYEHGYCFLRLFHSWVADVEHVRPAADFYADAAAGRLPSVSYIDPDFIEAPPANDDHAPADVRDGQRLVGKIVNALMKGPAWSKTLLIITYDEHGGFFDHVVPPAAANVSGVSKYGVRVPTFVISPWVDRGAVSHTVFDHTSILKTIIRRFCAAKPPDLGERVAAARDLEPLLRTKLRTDAPVIGIPQSARTRLSAPERYAELAELSRKDGQINLDLSRDFHALLALTRARYGRSAGR